jgi:hypothetical protein
MNSFGTYQKRINISNWHGKIAASGGAAFTVQVLAADGAITICAKGRVLFKINATQWG